MNSPRVTALCVITRERSHGREFLVQCADDEAFYRFPGGMIEHGEMAADTIRREMREEYDLAVTVGPLWVVNENIFTDRDRLWHIISLIHTAQLDEAISVDELRHKEYTDVKLVWRSPAAWATKPVYPAGIQAHLHSAMEPIIHLVSPTEVW
jgi:ADP-ribose pyrophosphatase YjhB (NUDIX family)